MRLAMGFVVSPLAIPLALFVVLGGASLASVRTFAASSFFGLVRQTAALSPIAMIIGYLVTFFIAAPMVTWLLNRGKATRRRMLILGVCLGGAPFLAYLAYVAAWELWRAAGFPTDTPVLGVWGTLDRLARDGPAAAVWLSAGIASGGATAAVLLLVAGEDIDSV